MEALIKRTDGVRLRRIDVRSWDSDVAQAFAIRRLPSLWLYDGTRQVTTDSREVVARLETRIER